MADSSDPSVLPDRTDAAEEAFVARWRGGVPDEASLDALIEACRQAVEARRWMLAARLVTLIPEGEGEDPELTRARQAARLVVVHKLQPEDVSWSALTGLWSKRNHVRRMRRARARWGRGTGHRGKTRRR